MWWSPRPFFLGLDIVLKFGCVVVDGCLLIRRPHRRRCDDVFDDGMAMVRACIVALMSPDLLILLADDAFLGVVFQPWSTGLGLVAAIVATEQLP